MPIDYSAQAAAAQKQGDAQMATQQGGYPGAEADMTAAEAVAAALNMSADGSALGLPAHVDHLGQVCICASLVGIHLVFVVLREVQPWQPDM